MHKVFVNFYVSLVLVPFIAPVCILALIFVRQDGTISCILNELHLNSRKEVSVEPYLG